MRACMYAPWHAGMPQTCNRLPMTASKDDIALKRAMQIASQGKLRKQQLDDMLRDRDWYEVASFAASCCQSQALQLKPWQSPPCVCDEDDPDERDKQGQALLKRMLAARISRYDPDPLAALEKAAKGTLVS